MWKELRRHCAHPHIKRNLDTLKSDDASWTQKRTAVPGHRASRDSAEMRESREVGLRAAFPEKMPWRHKPRGLRANLGECLEAERSRVGQETPSGLRALPTCGLYLQKRASVSVSRVTCSQSLQAVVTMTPAP